MALNVKGIFYLIQALVPFLEKGSTPGDPARIINVGSVAGLFPQPIPAFAYQSYASKFTCLISEDMMLAKQLYTTSL